jgi:hypothetical protein
MDYEETLLLLDGVEGTYAIVYPAPEPEAGVEPKAFSGAGLWVAGLLKREREREQSGAEARRLAMVNIKTYREIQPDLDLGDAPLERYERQAASYTFEGMDDLHGTTGFAGFTLWRHEFVESRWLDMPVCPAWLWITTGADGLIVAADFPGASSD